MFKFLSSVTLQQHDNLFTGLFWFPQEYHKNGENIKELFQLNSSRAF